MDEHNIGKGTFKTIQIIYASLMIGILLFAGAVYAFAENPRYTIDTSDLFFVAVPLVAASGFYVGTLLYNRSLSSLQANDTLRLKLMKYQTATLVRAACLEGPAFLAVVVAFISSNMIFLAVALLLVVMMYLTFPSKEKFELVVPLNANEKSQLDTL